MQIKVVKGTNRLEFEKKCNELLKDGFEPNGCLQVCQVSAFQYSDKSGKQWKVAQLIQGFVKH